MILTITQAKAVYKAMCELNNVGARLGELDFDGLPSGVFITVFDFGTAGIHVKKTRGGLIRTEGHVNQAAFAAAYGLA